MKQSSKGYIKTIVSKSGKKSFCACIRAGGVEQYHCSRNIDRCKAWLEEMKTKIREGYFEQNFAKNPYIREYDYATLDDDMCCVGYYKTSNGTASKLCLKCLRYRLHRSRMEAYNWDAKKCITLPRLASKKNCPAFKSAVPITKTINRTK